MSGGLQRGSVPTTAVPLTQIFVRLDAIAIRWGLDGDERSALLDGMVPSAVDAVQAYDAAAAERRARLLVELDTVAAAVLIDGCRIRDWLRRPNTALGGSAPLNVIANSPDWMLWLIHSLRVAM